MAQLKPTAMPDLKVRKQITAAALVKEIELPPGNVEGTNTWAWSVALAPDDRTLLVGSDGRIVIVDLVAGTTRVHDVPVAIELQYLSHRVYAVRFTPDRERVVGVTSNGWVVVLAWPSLDEIARYEIAPKDKGLIACAVMPDGKSAWVGGHDCKRTRVELATGRRLACQSGEWGWVSDLALSPDGSTLISSDAATIIRFCDGEWGRERSQLELGNAYNIVVSATEALIPNLYTAIVSMPDGKVVTKLQGEHKLGANCAVYAGDTIITGGAHDPLMVIWDRATGRPLLSMKPLKKGTLPFIVVVGDQLVTVPRYVGPLQVWRTAELVAAARSR